MKEREIAEKMITDGEAMIADAKAKLSELDAPRLRHGDYGVTPDGCPRMITAEFAHNGEGIEQHGIGGTRSCNNKLGEIYVLGNIFDDIANKGKKLEKFEVIGDCAGSIIVKKNHRNRVVIELCGSNQNFSVDESQEICDKLQQVINYAKDFTDG